MWLQFTKAFSNELAGRNIPVNCICPGYVCTPLPPSFQDGCVCANYGPMTKTLAPDQEYNDFIILRTDDAGSEMGRSE